MFKGLSPFHMASLDKKTYKIGTFGVGGKLTLDDMFLAYQHPYGRTFRVPVKDIQSVTVDVIGWGKGTLKIIGNGAELAREKMPISWANKCQEWILKNK